MRETIEQFLARGGVITKCEYVAPEGVEVSVRSTTGGAPQVMDLSTGAHFFAEVRPFLESAPYCFILVR